MTCKELISKQRCSNISIKIGYSLYPINANLPWFFNNYLDTEVIYFEYRLVNQRKHIYELVIQIKEVEE